MDKEENDGGDKEENDGFDVFVIELQLLRLVLS